MEPVTPIVVVGEQVAGQAAKLRKKANSLIELQETCQYDLGETLMTIQDGRLYTEWGYNTYTEWIKTTQLKPSKGRYLPQIARVMKAIGVSREKYETIGRAKLREICSLDPTAVYTHPITKEDTSMHNYIAAMTDKALTDGESYTLKEIQKHVRTLKGIAGENDNAFIGFVVKRSALDNVVRPVLDRAKSFIGSVGKDDEGNSKDATDGAALEVICIAVFNAGDEFLAPGETAPLDNPALHNDAYEGYDTD